MRSRSGSSTTSRARRVSPRDSFQWCVAASRSVSELDVVSGPGRTVIGSVPEGTDITYMKLDEMQLDEFMEMTMSPVRIVGR